MKKFKLLLITLALFAGLSARNTGNQKLDHAVSRIQKEYGDKVSIQNETEDLFKFGRNSSVGTSAETIWNSPAANETYVATNAIDSAISTDVADTIDLTLIGDTVNAGLFYEVTQTVTLSGTTAVALTTPLARANRAFNANSVDFVGSIHITEPDTYAAGVPDNDSTVHLTITAGKNQSDKAATTVPNNRYWILTSVYADVLAKAASFAEITLEIRLQGKVFRHKFTGASSPDNSVRIDFDPLLIVPKNADVRLRAISDNAGGRDVSGGIQGYLAIVE